MKYDSAMARLEIFVGSGILAAHASHSDKGFRQRDARFFIELFMNWADDLGPAGRSIQNTQLLRYIEALVQEGYARQLRTQRAPTYRLTRIGLLEILTRIASPSPSIAPSHFLFLVCFIRSYKHRLEALIAAEGHQFPIALKLELSTLLDVDELIRSEKTRVKHAILRIEERAHDAVKTSELTRQRLASRVPFDDIVREAEQKYPYELNTMKPLSELISSLVPDQRRWELEEGNTIRANTIWKPQRAMLEEYLRQLKGL
jgi:hypothetical protein